MTPIRKRHGSAFKARVALEAARNERTLSEFSREYGVHPIQIGKWRKELLERAGEFFTDGRRRTGVEASEQEIQELYEQIGRLKVDNDFLKKNLVLSAEEKRRLIDPNHETLSIAQQCELSIWCRTTF